MSCCKRRRPPLLPTLLVLSAALFSAESRAFDNSAVCGRVPPAAASPPAMTGNASKCVDGPWIAAEDDTPDIAPVRYETDHFAFRWHGEDASVADATEAGTFLESAWKYITGDPVGMEPQSCEETTKFKYNVHIIPGAGLTGGANGKGVPGMWMAREGLKDRWGMAHEMTHGLQFRAGGSGGVAKSNGWSLESHANWTAHQLPEHHGTNVHCSEMQVNYPHLYYGSTRMRYCNWQFWEYIKNHFGYKTVANLWSAGAGANPYGFPTDDILGLLASQNGWSLEKLNDVFGDWAMSNVGWNYTNPDGTDQGKFYRESYGPYDSPFGEAGGNEPPPQNMGFDPGAGGPQQKEANDRYLRMTRLDPVDLEGRIFAVQDLQAPERWGYNVVRLMPDAAATAVTVNFKGVVQAAPALKTLPGRKQEPTVIPEPASGWRWGLVTIGADGAETGRSKLMAGSVGETSLPFKQGERMYLVVMGTPRIFHQIGWDQPCYSIYRYPWMAKFTGAFPQGFEPNAPTPTPAGRKHQNGGGWVAEGASVDETAYVAPYAVVLGGKVTGNARIEDHAIIIDGEVSGNAVVGGLTVVTGGVVIKDNAIVKTSFKGPGMFEQGASITGDAVVYGDVELRGGLNINEGYVTSFIHTTEAPPEAMVGSEILKKSAKETTTESLSQSSQLTSSKAVSLPATDLQTNVDNGEVTAKPHFAW